jgi:hypothetical protein
VPSISKTQGTRLITALAVLATAAVVVSPLSVQGGIFPTENLAARGAVFWVVTAGAYLALPFIRRGDIGMVSMWLVLAIGIAPCFAGRELNAFHMFADMSGVLMAAGPIYIARYRQVVQGDVRTLRRRQIDPPPQTAQAPIGQVEAGASL